MTGKRYFILALLGSLFASVAFLIEVWHVMSVRTTPILSGRIVDQKPILQFGALRADITIQIDGKPERVHARVQRDLMSTLPPIVRFHYAGDPSREVFLFEHEENPLWIAGSFWLVTIAIGGFGLSRSGRRFMGWYTTPEHSSESTNPKASAPVPWNPEESVDIPRTLAKFQYYTNHRKAFVVFKHGTCVVIPDLSPAPEHDAKAILRQLRSTMVDWTPHLMDDGNFTVSYAEPAYSIVFKEEADLHQLVSPEKETRYFGVGVFGRARLFLDLENPIIVQVWRPSGSATSSKPNNDAAGSSPTT